MVKQAADLAIRRPRTVMAVWLVVFAVGLGLGSAVFGRLGGLGGSVPGSQSQRTAERIDRLAPPADSITGLVATTTPGRVIATDPAVRRQVGSAVTALRAVAGVTSVPDPFQTPGMTGDGQAVAIRVGFAAGLSPRDEQRALDTAVARLRAISADGTKVVVSGGPLLDDALSSSAQHDAQQAEVISLPIVLALLLVVFGGLLAASLPLVLAFCGIAATLLILYGFSTVTSLSVYSVQITTMLGLGLGVDYALLMVTRFREERARTPERADVADCVRRTVAGAGRTVFFSGLTVGVSLVGIVVYQAPFLRSLGLAATAVVAVDMLAAVTLLPALLSRYGWRISPAGAPRRLWRRGGAGAAGATGAAAAAEGRSFARIATAAVRRPALFLVVIAAGLLTLGAPATALAFTTGDARELPPTSEARQVYDLSVAHFPGYSAADPLGVLVPDGASRPAYLAHLEKLPGVVSASQHTYPDGSAVLSLTPSGTSDGPVATGLVATIRGEHAGAMVTGSTAHLVDYRAMLAGRLPFAIGAVVLAVFVLLFLFTGSVLIPLKAILTNLLSIGAALGAMVYVFQQGHLAGLFGTSGVGGLDITVPPLMIAVAFGLSMDYEIFILGRIREARLAGEPARRAIVTGVRHTGRVVTCAALLLVIVFASFMTGGSAPILEFGLGLTLAVLVDATLVRLLLVPATLALLGERAWWAPAPLARLHRRFGLSEGPAAPLAGDAAAGAADGTAAGAIETSSLQSA